METRKVSVDPKLAHVVPTSYRAMRLSSAWGIQSLESLRDGEYMYSVIGNHSDIDTNHRGNTKFWALALSRNLINITQVFPLLYCQVYPGGKYPADFIQFTRRDHVTTCQLELGVIYNNGIYMSPPRSRTIHYVLAWNATALKPCSLGLLTGRDRSSFSGFPC